MVIRVVAIGALVGLVTAASGPGIAQDRPAAPGRASPGQTAQAPAPAPQGQAAQPAQPPAAPIRTEILKFDSWTATCNEFEAPKKRTCAAQLQVLQSGSTQVILTWGVFINDNKQLVTVLQTPTGVTIAPGVKLRLEKAAERTLPFETCDNGQCTASQVIDNNLLRDMGAASSAQVTVQAVNGNQVNFNFAVKGIDKALAHLRGKI